MGQLNKVIHTRPSVEERTEHKQTLFYICYLYVTRPTLSKAAPQGNSIFITKLVSRARGKAVLLLSLPLLFLLRSSQMLCLREINGFLNSFSASCGCSRLPRVITSRTLREAAFWKLKSGAVLSSRTPATLGLARFNPSFTLQSLPSVTSPNRWAQWLLCTSFRDGSQVCL